MTVPRASDNSTPTNFSLLMQMFRQHLLILILPVAIFSTAAAVYIYRSHPTWRATQSLQVRDELVEERGVPGRFDSLDFMKMFQETVLDTVRRPAVIRNVLEKMEPPKDHKHPEAWPTVEDIEAIQASIELAPPNGAEFGRTEVLLLSVKSSSIERAIKIVRLLSKELQQQLNELRDQRAQSIEFELQESVQLARLDLESSTEELKQFELKLGDLLFDLRSISAENGPGTSGLQNRLNVIIAETRSFQQRKSVLEKNLQQVHRAVQDPGHLLTLTSELLAAQPALQRLKEQLISQQAITAQTLGQFDRQHPKAKAALKAEALLMEKITEEIRVTEKGLETQVAVVVEQIQALQDNRKKIESQIQQLAEFRAPYASLVEQVRQKQTVLNRVEEELSRARANRASVKSTNLITLIDEPYSPSRPEGLSKKIVLGGSVLAGLVSGVGLVFFAAAPGFTGPFDPAPGPMALDQNQPAPDPARKRTRSQSRAQEETAIRKVNFAEKTDPDDDFDIEEMLGEAVQHQAAGLAAEIQEAKHSGSKVRPLDLASTRVTTNQVCGDRQTQAAPENPVKETATVDLTNANEVTFESEEDLGPDPTRVGPLPDRNELDQSLQANQSRLQAEHRRRIENMFRSDES